MTVGYYFAGALLAEGKLLGEREDCWKRVGVPLRLEKEKREE